MSGWSSTHTASRPTLVVRSNSQHVLSDNSSTVHSSSVIVLSPVRSRYEGHVLSDRHDGRGVHPPSMVEGPGTGGPTDSCRRPWAPTRIGGMNAEEHWPRLIS